jgi:hypothetical protein
LLADTQIVAALRVQTSKAECVQPDWASRFSTPKVLARHASWVRQDFT